MGTYYGTERAHLEADSAKLCTMTRMTSNEKRFEIVHEQKSLTGVIRILRDSETGVCYLQTWSGPSGGLTVLLNADGSPVVQLT